MSAARAPVLEGKKALLVGIANEHSIAYGCAAAFRELGAELAITYVKEKTRQYVAPLAQRLEAPIFMPLDVAKPGQLEAVFERIAETWGRLDIMLHAISGGPKNEMRGGLLDCSAEGFGHAMDVSCHSFVRMARLAAPLMTDGGTMFAMSYLGANRVVPNYNIMGPVKAALEAAVRYMAVDLGPRHIRVNALSPGPVATRAASGIAHFDELLQRAVEQAPEHRLVTVDDVGALAAFLVNDEAKAITGNIAYVDAGYHVVG